MRTWAIAAFLVFTSFAAPAASQDMMAANAAYRDLQNICLDDDAQLWNATLCAPLIIVDPATRTAWASDSDDAGVLQSTGAGWVGPLPNGVPIANTAVTWGGRQWIMVMAPLPANDIDRRVLIAHEAWHQIQVRIGLTAQPSDASHLEQEQARTLLRLEFRALATALRSSGRARRNAAQDALMFRITRLAMFPGASAQETALDRNEGLASYTGVRLGVRDNPEFYAAQILDNYDTHEAYARSYAYASGPAYGLLLDIFRRGWRYQLEEDAPADLLASRLRVRVTAERMAEARARYGAGAIAAEEAARAQSQRQRLADLRALFTTGPRLVLPLRSMQMEFNPNQVTPVEGLGSVYGVLTIRDVWGELRATQPALISPTFTELVVPSPDATGLAGPGWQVTLSPGFQVGAPGPDGARGIEVVTPPAPASAPAD